MKRPTVRSGKPFALITGVYLLLSLFGSALYLVLPPFLCSMGARIHAYLLINAALPSEPQFFPVVLMILAHLYVFAMIVFGILAIVKGPSRLYVLMVGLEILMTGLFFLLQRTGEYEHTAGILFNILYFAWITRSMMPKRIKKKGIPKHGKL